LKFITEFFTDDAVMRTQIHPFRYSVWSAAQYINSSIFLHVPNIHTIFVY